MRRIFLVAACIAISAIAFAVRLAGQEQAKKASSEDDRIVTLEEVNRACHPASAAPLRVLFYPFHVLNSGMESGLISFEKHRMRERLNYWTEYLRKRGIAAMVGGLGEGTGMGLGASYTLGAGGSSDLRFLGRGTFARGYQEFDIRWTNSIRDTRLVLESSYQWRPEENFYGLGMDSREDQRTKFALRQTWAGVRFEYLPLLPRTAKLGIGAEYKVAWLNSMRSPNTLYTPPDVQFPGLPGFGKRVQLQSTGFYFDADGIRGEYRLGGMIHVGAALQDGLGDSSLKYFSYEAQLEGRLPIAKGRSVLVAQGTIEFDRARGGSEPIPFYLLPHIGGSSTLRGFNLDRFYGKNILFATLEYRYRIHPEFQPIIFFDEGQLFDQTSDLSWLNWQRNYGFGLRMWSARGVYFRLEMGWSGEGFQYHISWGDRERRPIGGPIRYGGYRR